MFYFVKVAEFENLVTDFNIILIFYFHLHCFLFCENYNYSVYTEQFYIGPHAWGLMWSIIMLIIMKKRMDSFYKNDFYFLICKSSLGGSNIYTGEHNYDAVNENDNDALQRSHGTRRHVIVMLYIAFWVSVFICHCWYFFHK